MSASAGTVYYLHGQNNDLGYEKEVKDNGLIEHKHYLFAGGIVFAMQVTRTGNTATGGVSGSAKPTQSLTYMHHDHLGSVSVLTDDGGSVIERLAYDPWGKRRFPNGTADTADSIVGLTLDRGFTMHEHLDEMGVIHMNGRIYDPLIGRFMSADPFIQAPENLQSHNRFAYVMNNPLSYTVPSGYFSLKQLSRALVFAMRVFVRYCDEWPNVASNKYSPSTREKTVKPDEQKILRRRASLFLKTLPYAWATYLVYLNVMMVQGAVRRDLITYVTLASARRVTDLYSTMRALAARSRRPQRAKKTQHAKRKQNGRKNSHWPM